MVGFIKTSTEKLENDCSTSESLAQLTSLKYEWTLCLQFLLMSRSKGFIFLMLWRLGECTSACLCSDLLIWWVIGIEHGWRHHLLDMPTTLKSRSWTTFLHFYIPICALKSCNKTDELRAYIWLRASIYLVNSLVKKGRLRVISCDCFQT